MGVARRLRALPALLLVAAAVAAGCGGDETAGAATDPAAAADDNAAARLDAALDRAVARSGTPGATAAVVDDGRLVWTGAAGRARTGHGGRMHPDSLFAIASTTKTVTAAMAMALAEAGELELDRPIRSTLPYLPGSGRITPRMLMSHSSGLADYLSSPWLTWTAWRHPFHRWTRREVLSHAPRRLRFPPGSRHSYSNTGYVALGGVIERASGARIESVFERTIAAPLGLEDSTFRYGAAPQRQFAHPLRPRAGGGYYDRFGPDGRIPTDYWGEVWTDGGLAATAADLAEFGNALYAGDLLEPATVEQMLPPKPGGWGLGTFDGRGQGSTWVGHDGSYGGYQTENWTDRERGVTVVVMTNGAGIGSLAPQLRRAIAAAYPG